jgi:DNA-binding MarR family transcriptional regulator
MNNSLIADRRISAQCFRVLCFLSLRTDENGQITISEREIAESCGVDRRTVSSALDEAVTVKLMRRTFRSGQPATYHLTLPDGDRDGTTPNDTDSYNDDDGGNWATAGEGDSSALADLILSRVNASSSDAFKQAAQRLIQWIRYGNTERRNPESSTKDKSILIRVAVVEHFAGLRSKESVVDFAERNGIHRSLIYRHLDSFEEMFGVRLHETRPRA